MTNTETTEALRSGDELKTVLETVDYWSHCWPQFFSSPETALDEIAKKVRATLEGAAS